MSVQNLRNRFNQNTDSATLSSPGTSFGTNKFKPTVKYQNGIILRQNSFGNGYSNGAGVITPPRWKPVKNGFTQNSESGNNYINDQKVNSSFLTNGDIKPTYVAKLNSEVTNSNGINSIKLNPVTNTNGVCQVNNSNGFNPVKPIKPHFDAISNINAQKQANFGVQNIANRWGSVAAKKTPELSRENLIKTRWSKSMDETDQTVLCKNNTTQPFVQKHHIQGTNNFCDSDVNFHQFNNNNSNQYNVTENKLTNGDQIATKYTTHLINNYNDRNECEANNTNDIHLQSKIQDMEKKWKDTAAQNQKLSKDYNDLERKYGYLQQEQNKTKEQLYEKTEQLIQLRKLSEAMCKEYDQLKTQYNLETTTMEKVMERASQWYKQNRELKRRSSVLMAQVMASGPDKIDRIAEMSDEVDNFVEQDAELEELRKTIKSLTHEVSKLQAELNSNKFRENETLQQTSELKEKLEDEKKQRSKAESQLKELERKFALLQNGENFTHLKTDNTYQPNLESNDDQSLEGRLKYIERELYFTEQRAEDAESQLAELTHKVSQLQMELDLKNQMVAPPPPPPMPFMPPPPPPPPPMISSPMGTLVKNRNSKSINGSITDDDSATEEMANLLGIPRKAGKNQVETGAIDKIINELKGGRYSLKTTEKLAPIKKDEEQSPVVNEMMNILGTLRRQPARRESFKRCANDTGTL